jgi:urease accessory protein
MATLFDKKAHQTAGLDLVSVPVLYLSHNHRQRNRLAAMLPDGKAVAIILPRGEYMSPGDLLTGADGSFLRIEAEQEPLMQVCAETDFDLMRLVYHLANRHVKAMLRSQAVFIQPDPILADMVHKLGGYIKEVQAVFEPEGGAYGGGHHHHEHEIDHAMGNVGEMLSIAAHQGRSA